jgi:hypothetical protein
MDIKRIRQLAGLSTSKAKAKKTSVKLNEDMDLFRKLAGLPAIVKEDDTESETPDTEKVEGEEEELPSIVSKIAAKAEGKTGDDLLKLLSGVYEAGFADGQASVEDESEEVAAEE